jgi:hypothetical protein
MRIHQVSVDFVAEEDRLRLRIATSEGAELRFWLTRRYLRLLWPALRSLAELANPVVQQSPERVSLEARKALVEMEHAEAVKQADFSKPFAPTGAEMPLGDAPLLLARVQGMRGPDGRPLLAMHTQQGRGLTLNSDSLLIHSLMKLLHQAAAQAQWDLALELPQAAAAPSAGSRLN